MMKGKLILLMVSTLAGLWSQTGLAMCSVGVSTGGIVNGNITLSQHSAVSEFAAHIAGSGQKISTTCDRYGGWVEANMVYPIAATAVSGVTKTNVPFVGVKVTAKLATENLSGDETVVLTDGNFMTRRWIIPEVETAGSRTFTVLSDVRFDFWAIGPEDPYAGVFGAQPILKLSSSDGSETTAVGFSGNASTVAGCSVYESDSNNGLIRMPATVTSDFSQIGILESSKKVLQFRANCDRDINLEFTLNDTGNTVSGFSDVLAPEPGGAEGIGATFRYAFMDDDSGNLSPTTDLKLNGPLDYFGGPVGEVRRGRFILYSYYYRFGSESQIAPGHFRSTATLNFVIQ